MDKVIISRRSSMRVVPITWFSRHLQDVEVLPANHLGVTKGYADSQGDCSLWPRLLERGLGIFYLPVWGIWTVYDAA